MGEVWLAHDPSLDRDVAIKILPPRFAADEDRLKRFLREARLAAKLHHTNAVTVIRSARRAPWSISSWSTWTGSRWITW